MPLKGWYNRGYLPHFDGGEICQFITFRLFDSMPQNLIEAWKIELSQEKVRDFDAALRRRIEIFLDSGYGCCYLKENAVAEIFRDSLFHLDDSKFKLISWIVMPNHVHLLIKPLPGMSLLSIMRSLKGWTARESNKVLQRQGIFWQRDYFDRFIRNHKHYLTTVDYIENNPVKAGLCENAEDWIFSSAYKGNANFPVRK